MRYLDLTLPRLEDNLALDEALLLQTEAGRGDEVLRIWEWPTPAVVLGVGGRIAEDVDEGHCQAYRVPILRRSSGGGTVLLCRGSLCYSLVLSYGRDVALGEIRSSYAYILNRLRDAFSDLANEIEFGGTSDLAIAGRKFSGNSQQRKRHHVLHHGTLLHNFDLSLVGRYLRVPARQPQYRRQRSHAEFLMNLPAGGTQLRQRLRNAWQADSELADWPENLVRQLVAEKYSRPEWIRRR